MESLQSEESLASLLHYLACPIDPDDTLTVVRNDDGRVTALRSRNGSFPVVNNVPRMIPPWRSSSARDLNLWEEFQGRTWQDYQDGTRNVFSTGDAVTGYLGEVIGQCGAGLFLDIGCGVLPSPDYMAAAGSGIRWIGVDPLLGDVARHFPFVQAVGEYLPFRSHIFDGVLYASTIWSHLHPEQSLEQARRALKPRGKLYLSYEPERLDARYIGWRIQRMLGWPSHYSSTQRWAFTERSLRSLLRRAGFSIEDRVLLCVRCPKYATCPRPASLLVVARQGVPG